LPLLTVELAFNDQTFELTENDAEILIQLRTNSVLWQKERLINIGIESLPPDCDKFAWLDADIMFTEDEWVKKTAKLLEIYVVVQPFSMSFRLPREVHHFDLKASPPWFSDARGEKKEINLGTEDGQRIHSFCFGITNFGKSTLPWFLLHGHTGFAWAARRSAFQEIGLYDRLIGNGGDLFMSYAFIGENDSFKIGSSELMRLDQSEWADRIFQQTKGSIAYLDGYVAHFWHGDQKDRRHNTAFPILKKHEFDPRADIRKDENDCWTWSSTKPALHEEVQKIFWLRNEEGSAIRNLMMKWFLPGIQKK